MLLLMSKLLELEQGYLQMQLSFFFGEVIFFGAKIIETEQNQ